MQIVGASRQGQTLVPLRPPVGHPVPVGILQFPNARRRPGVNRAVVPKHSLRKHQLIREHDALIVMPIPVRVLQPQNPVRLLGQLFLHLVIRARRIRHVQPALVIKIRHHRTQDQRRPRHQLDLEPSRQCEGVRRQINFGGTRALPDCRHREGKRDDNGIECSDLRELKLTEPADPFKQESACFQLGWNFGGHSFRAVKADFPQCRRPTAFCTGPHPFSPALSCRAFRKRWGITNWRGGD